ncbi:MAG: hypothetical protein HQ509_12080 [Candidatus Marinimicrobia bacterium]|nr:hypothetical protein [Candidatus Neomarinimicrobiota bacterium]
MKKYFYLNIFIPLLLVGQHPVTLYDPLFALQLQSLKFNQELDVYKESNPWINTSQAQKYYPLKETQANIRILPQAFFAENGTDHQFNLWTSATLDNITMLADVRLIQAEHNMDYFGSEYSRSGINGRVNTAFVRYENDRYLAQFGRSPVVWGSTYSSIIQSGLAPSYEHFDGKINMGDFTVEVLGGQLGSEYLSDGTRIKRYISGHQVNWLSCNNSLLIGVGEQIIYTGQNRSLEWVYLNPFVPYVFTAFDKDEEPTGAGDNDNSIIFMYLRYNYKPNLSVYSEMIIDDYQLDDTGRQNALGINVGLDWGTHIFNKPTTGSLSYTQIDSWSYIHHGQFTNWENRSHPIGYYYGLDVRSVGMLTDIWVTPSLYLNLDYTYVEKGNNLLSSGWGNDVTEADPFPSVPVTVYHFVNISLSRYMKNGLLELGWSNKPFDNQIAHDGQYFTDYGLYLKYQLVWGFGFDLE